MSNHSGEIHFSVLPQADSKSKPRPVLLIAKVPKYDDYIVAGISSKLYEYMEGIDLILNPTPQNQLARQGLVRVTFLTTMPFNELRGYIGRVEANELQNVKSNLAAYLIS